jgi:hypothetical protein
VKRLLFLSFCVSTILSTAQGKSVIVGFEQDALPYILDGYFANVWVGKGHVRSRLLFANVRKPDLLLTDGFTNNRVNAYAITADYFSKEDWKGWWISAGGVLWKNSLQTDLKQQTAHFNTYLVNGSLGYSWKLT